MIRAKALVITALLFLATSPSVMACATCFGASDSPMAKGMNWGIFSLLVVVVTMLSGIAAFFVFLAKKSAQMSSLSAPEQLPLETKNV